MTKKESKFIQKYLEYYSKYGDDIPTEGWDILSKYRKSLGIDYQRSKILIEEAICTYENSMQEEQPDPKEKTRSFYNEICSKLRKSIKQIKNIPGSTKEFQKIQQSFVDTLSVQLNRARQDADNTLNSTEWDKLVIAFFGETNAGKSTIIETFRILFDETERRKNINASFFRRLKNAYYEIPTEGHSKVYEVFMVFLRFFDVRKWFQHVEYAVDGTIVGDGRHDFTKVYKEYEMNVCGKSFVLIDVPGIEGNEDDYKDEIKTALSKAHCVFYVQGHNKTTDSATAEKIKKYLRNWVKVYTIYNVRSSADTYEYPEQRIELIDDSVRKVCDGIEKTFFEILGDSYGGNTITQGFIALSSHAIFSPKRKDLIRKQNKLLLHFGSREDLYKFSSFDSVVNLVNEKASNYTNEIYEANKDKLFSLSNQTIVAIDQELSAQKGAIERYRTIINNYKREVIGYFNSVSHTIETQLRDKHDTEFRKLKESVFYIISDDEEEKEERIRNAVKVTSNNMRDGIKQLIVENTKKLNIQIKESGRKLEGLPISIIESGNMDGRNPNIYVPSDDILRHLDISLGDIISFGIDIVGSASTGAFIGGLFGPLGAGIGAGLGAIAGGFIKVLSGDGGVGKAQEEARKKIEEASTKSWTEIQQKVLFEINSSFNQHSTRISDEVGKALTGISKLDNAINDTKKSILNFENKIKTETYGCI